MHVSNPHAQIDEELYLRDRRVAAAIRRNPQVIERAKRNLQDWELRWGEPHPTWIEWSQLLRMLTPEQLADFLESHTPKANRLRQSSPFIGALDGVEGAERID